MGDTEYRFYNFNYIGVVMGIKYENFPLYHGISDN